MWRGSFGGGAWNNMSTAFHRAKDHSLRLRQKAEQYRRRAETFAFPPGSRCHAGARAKWGR
jgi:hypothetical protein